MFQSVVRGSCWASAHVSAGHEKLSDAEAEGGEADAEGLLEGVWDIVCVAITERVREGANVALPGSEKVTVVLPAADAVSVVGRERLAELDCDSDRLLKRETVLLSTAVDDTVRVVEAVPENVRVADNDRVTVNILLAVAEGER